MAIYMHNINTLKPRIKSLHAALSLLNNINVTLGQCRDLVSRSLGWAHWNEMYLAHQVSTPINTRENELFITGNFYADETRRQQLAETLSGLLVLAFPEQVNNETIARGLACEVWANPRQDALFGSADNPEPTVMANDIPAHMWRDHLFVDVTDTIDTMHEVYDFRQEVLMPILARHGGIIFCLPDELRSLVRHYHKKGVLHRVVMHPTTQHFAHDLPSTSIPVYLDWRSDSNVLTKALTHFFSWAYNGTTAAPDADSIALFAQKMLDDNANETPLTDSDIADIFKNRDPDLAFLCHELWRNFAQALVTKNVISYDVLLNDDAPAIIPVALGDLQRYLIMSALFKLTREQTNQVLCRQKTVSCQTPPKLLIFRMGDTGYTEYPEHHQMLNSLGWSTVFFNERHNSNQFSRWLMANAGNIVNLRRDDLKRKILRREKAVWYSLRNSSVPLCDAAKAISSYATLESDISMPKLSLQW